MQALELQLDLFIYFFKFAASYMLQVNCRDRLLKSRAPDGFIYTFIEGLTACPDCSSEL